MTSPLRPPPGRLAMALLALVLGACGPAGETPAQITPAVTQPPEAPGTTAPPQETVAAGELPEKIVIGYPASLTGQFEALGRAGNDGLQLFEQWINEEQGGIEVGGTKLPVEIVFADDRSDLDTATRLFENMVTEEGAHFMMASYSSSLTLAEAPIAERLDVLAFGWGAASDDIWQQGFTTIVGVITPSSLYDEGFLEFTAAADPPAQRVAIVYKDDPFTVAEGEGALEVAEGLGMEVVFVDRYPREATDLSPILTQAAATEPDIMLVDGHFQDGALAARQMSELDIRPNATLFGSASATTDWAAELGEAAQGTYGASQWEPDQELDTALFEEANWRGPKVTPQEWAAQFEEEFGYVPDFRAAMAFHAAVVLSAAIEEAGALETDSVREALKAMEIRTVGGEFRVDETLNQVGHTMVTIQWQEGAKVIVAPEESATGQALYPVG